MLTRPMVLVVEAGPGFWAGVLGRAWEGRPGMGHFGSHCAQVLSEQSQEILTGHIRPFSVWLLLSPGVPFVVFKAPCMHTQTLTHNALQKNIHTPAPMYAEHTHACV